MLHSEPIKYKILFWNPIKSINVVFKYGYLLQFLKFFDIFIEHVSEVEIFMGKSFQ